MKKLYISFCILLAAVLTFNLTACNDFPVDEDGLLITTRSECYVSSFELLGTDHQTVIDGAAVIDTLAQRIDVDVRYGTNLKSLWPQFTLCQDAKLDPKVTGFTDFSDLENPRQYTVISGDRKIHKVYTIFIKVKPLN